MKRVITDLWKKYRSFIIKIYGILAIVLFYRCPVKIICDVDCPGCGLTRACLSALKFDFRAAFEYHPLCPLFGACMVYFIFYEPINRKIKLGSKLTVFFAIATAVVFIAVWLIRTFV